VASSGKVWLHWWHYHAERHRGAGLQAGETRSDLSQLVLEPVLSSPQSVQVFKNQAFHAVSHGRNFGDRNFGFSGTGIFGDSRDFRGQYT